MRLTADVAAALRTLNLHGIEKGMLALLVNTPGDEVDAAIDAACDTDLPQLLTSTQVAHLLDVSNRTIWRMVRAGTLPQPVRYSRKLARWRRADLSL